jgi:hypothetical protein
MYEDPSIPYLVPVIGIVKADGQVQEFNIWYVLQQLTVPRLIDQAVAYPVPYLLERPEKAHVYRPFHPFLVAGVEQALYDALEWEP